MKIRPYPAWALLAMMLVLSTWRLHDRPGAEYLLGPGRISRWASLARMTPEELDRGLAHRYDGLAAALGGEAEVGYFSERSSDDLWRLAAEPGGKERIHRYYMAQGLLPPSVLRLDAIRPLVVVDCSEPEQAERVMRVRGLTPVRDFGGGLVLARPGS
jgi:hypothetical protein